MISKYFYKGNDITLDVFEKLCCVSEILAAREGLSFEEAYLRFSKTRVYRNLQDSETLMWFETPEYMVDDYYREKESQA